MYKTIILTILIYILLSGFGYCEKNISLVTHESPPYSGISSTDTGILNDFVKKAFNVAGYDVRIEIFPWKRALESVKKGRYDGLFGCWYREERLEWFVYSEPLVSNRLIFVQRSSDNISFNGNYSQIVDLGVGYIRGYSLPPGLQDITKVLKMEYVTSYIQNLDKLRLKRVDLVIIDRYLFRHIINENQDKYTGAFKEIDHILSQDTNFLVISKAVPNYMEKLQDFNRAVIQLKNQGYLAKIIQKYNLDTQE